MRRHLIRFASAPFISSRLAAFGWVRVGSTMQNLWRVGENSDPIVSRLWTKVHKIFRRCRKPLYFPKSFPDCLCHVLFTRYSPLSLEVVEKLRKCKSLLAPIFVGGTAPTFLRQFVRATYYPLLGKKFGWVLFADLRLRSLVIKQNAEFTEGG